MNIDCGKSLHHLKPYQESWGASILDLCTAPTVSIGPKDNKLLSEPEKTLENDQYQESVETYTDSPWTVVMGKKSTH